VHHKRHSKTFIRPSRISIVDGKLERVWAFPGSRGRELRTASDSLELFDSRENTFNFHV
jgi:hypothetical protein